MQFFIKKLWYSFGFPVGSEFTQIGLPPVSIDRCPHMVLIIITIGRLIEFDIFCILYGGIPSNQKPQIANPVGITDP